MSDQLTVTTDVAIRVFETTPAVVSFNYQEISDHLDGVLEKYKGLVFSDSDVAECKKTIAELRKGQKSLDEFRKATKKQLTESVTAFEAQCKLLYGKFDTVLRPLTEQQDQFELDCRELKRVEIQSVIDSLIVEKLLSDKYAEKLVILEDYFNKGKKLKDIKTELSALANTLSVQEDKEAQDIDLIKTKVELANAQYQLIENALMPEPYLRLLAYNKPVSEIDLLITSDAQQIREREKKAAEDLIAKAAEAPKVVEAVMTETFTDPKSAPTVTVAAGEKITATYEITGTQEQLSALEEYLDTVGLNWSGNDDFLN